MSDHDPDDAELRRWLEDGKAPSGICPHCGSRISVVHRDELFYARCSHRGCGARGPLHSRLTSAVDAFCRPPAYVLRHMGVHPSSLTDVVTMLEAERDELRDEVERLRGLLARVETWTQTYGAALKPSGADTYGEGMRVAKWQVSNLIRAGGLIDE